MSTFLLRCDASPTIGHGHLRRSASLAAALRELGYATWFATAECPDDLARELVADGASVHRLPRGAGDRTEAIARLANEVDAATVVVDDYTATAATFEAIRSHVPRLAVVDDIADRDLGAVDCVLNQNLHAATLPYRVRPNCTQLLGPRFAMLRRQFVEARERDDRRTTSGVSDARNVLVTLGGGETGGLVASALAALDGVERTLTIRCVLGGPASGAVVEAARRSRHEVELLGRIDDMAAEMSRADLSINAGGSTTWELCCLGVPMVVTVLSTDQAPIAASLVEHGIASRVDVVDETFDASLAEQVEAWLTDPGRRSAASRTGRELVDGHGARRAAAALVELAAAA